MIKASNVSQLIEAINDSLFSEGIVETIEYGDCLISIDVVTGYIYIYKPDQDEQNVKCWRSRIAASIANAVINFIKEKS